MLDRSRGVATVMKVVPPFQIRSLTRLPVSATQTRVEANITDDADVESADESILVVDESKLGRLKPAFFSPLDAFSRVIVGGSSARQQRSHFKGIKLDIVT